MDNELNTDDKPSTGGQSLLKDAEPHVHEVVRAAHQELESLVCQRSEIVRRIGLLKQTIQGLANLFGDDILGGDPLGLGETRLGNRQRGFTEACRIALLESGCPLSAREVCDRIRQRTPALLVRHKDPLASVTTVLNRLVAYGEAQQVIHPQGGRAWQWASNSGGVSGQDPVTVSQVLFNTP